MDLISYAQNLEDVLLWRALGHVSPGFYIDVGANDPVVESVTKLFYDRGWRGINIEATAEYHERLCLERPEDINLHVAAGEIADVLPCYTVPGTGLSTLDASIAAGYSREGRTVLDGRVEVETLTSVCRRHVRGDIHFLKIDVEGWELPVLRGMDLSAYRPWVIVVEATRPLSQLENHAPWEESLLTRGYRFVHFDGLNRFYLDEARKDLLPRFAAPPNWFDHFVRHSEVEWRERLEEAERARGAADEQLAASRQQRDEMAAELARVRDDLEESRRDERQGAERLREREKQLEALYRSRSWRATAPVRALLAAARRLRRTVARGWGGRGTLAKQPRPRNQTIFIECTHTYHSDLNTGIQRVVRNVLRNAESVGANLGYDVVPVLVENGTFLPVDVARLLVDKRRTPVTGAISAQSPSIPAPFSAGPVRFLRPPWRLLQRSLDATFPYPAARRFIWAPRSTFGLAGLLLAPWRLFRRLGDRIRRLARGGSEESPPLTLNHYESLRGSILLLLDSSWTTPLWTAVEQFKVRGGRVAGVIYDLVPVTHTHTTVPNLTTAFRAWLYQQFRLSDGFIAISRSVADQVREYIASPGNSADRIASAPIGHFHLGSELDFFESGDPVREAVRDIFRAPRHVFLMVGSIEPRKNHAYVLDAFDAFWASGNEGTLLLVGRQAWRTEPFLERVRNHAQTERQLFLLRDVSDSELDYAYRNASSLVIASEIEGFGLPIVEAFQRGLPVMCSDIPVFHEIADGRAAFFDLADSGSLLEALLEFCRRNDPAVRDVRHPQPWMNWQQSTGQLFEELLRVTGATKRSEEPGRQG